MNKFTQIFLLASLFAILGQVCESAEMVRKGPEVELEPVDSGEETTENPSDDAVDLARSASASQWYKKLISDDDERVESRGWLCSSYYYGPCSSICVSLKHLSFQN